MEVLKECNLLSSTRTLASQGGVDGAGNGCDSSSYGLGGGTSSQFLLDARCCGINSHNNLET